jgi:hypothetical protein
VRAGMKEWLRQGPNKRMTPDRRAKCRQTRYPDPKHSAVHQTGASPLAAFSFALAVSARASVICLSASFWVASVIWYPTHAETKAAAIPIPPNTNAPIVAHPNDLLASRSGIAGNDTGAAAAGIAVMPWGMLFAEGDLKFEETSAVVRRPILLAPPF